MKEQHATEMKQQREEMKVLRAEVQTLKDSTKVGEKQNTIESMKREKKEKDKQYEEMAAQLEDAIEVCTPF